jgi:hypothetical protein
MRTLLVLSARLINTATVPAGAGPGLPARRFPTIIVTNVCNGNSRAATARPAVESNGLAVMCSLKTHVSSTSLSPRSSPAMISGSPASNRRNNSARGVLPIRTQTMEGPPCSRWRSAQVRNRDVNDPASRPGA